MFSSLLGAEDPQWKVYSLGTAAYMFFFFLFLRHFLNSKLLEQMTLTEIQWADAIMEQAMMYCGTCSYGPCTRQYRIIYSCHRQPDEMK